MKNIPPAPSLVMLIGPTGAGKSTWIAKHFNRDKVIASDDIRIELGEARGLTRDDLPTLLRSVWKIEEKEAKQEYRRRVEQSLVDGNRVVAEASHLRKEDRLAIADIGHGLRVPVIYIVLNRPLKDKWETAGWRALVPTIIDKQEKMFEENKKDILCGDERPNTSVIDIRTSL